MEKFSIDEAIQYGWNMMKANIGFFIIVLLIVFVVQMVPAVISSLIEKTMPVLSTVISILSGLINLIMGIGLIHIALKLHDDRNPSLQDLFSSGAALIFKYFVSSLMYGLIIAGVVIALIAPVAATAVIAGKSHVFLIGTLAAVAIAAGIILVTWLMLKFQFYGYLIIDQNLGAVEALNKSAALTRGAKGQLLILGLVLGLINIAGCMVLFVGLFASVPVSMMAMAYVYRKLAKLGDVQTRPAAGD